MTSDDAKKLYTRLYSSRIKSKILCDEDCNKRSGECRRYFSRSKADPMKTEQQRQKQRVVDDYCEVAEETEEAAETAEAEAATEA